LSIVVVVESVRGFIVIIVIDFEVCVGVRVLVDGVMFCVVDGDCVGLVGCNGVGKMIFIKIFVGDGLLVVGMVISFGECLYF